MKRRGSAFKPFAFSSGLGAFTLIELLVCIAIIAILASLLLPVLGRAKLKAQGLACMNHVKQMGLALNMYAGDNRDGLPWTIANKLAERPGAWVTWSLTNPYTQGRPNWETFASPLMPYLKSLEVWKCPANKPEPNLSIALNYYIGGQNMTNEVPTHRKFSVIPPNVFLFTDKREDVYASLYTVFLEYPPSFNDYPASYHNGSGTFSFADGHAEIHRWKDPRTTPPIGTPFNGNDCVNNQDAVWLRERAY